MTTALEGMRGQRHAPAALYPRERPGIHCTEGWVGPRDGLDRFGKSRPTGIRSPDRPARSQSLYRLRYPAHMASVGRYWFTVVGKRLSLSGYSQNFARQLFVKKPCTGYYEIRRGLFADVTSRTDDVTKGRGLHIGHRFQLHKEC